MADSVLTSAAVRDLLVACLAGDAPCGETIDVEGIVATFRFSASAVSKHTPDIERLIAEVDPTFLRGESGGGGWTFLNLCNDCHGHQWTGLQAVMEMLCALAIAARRGQWLLPREFWSALPGGVPYIEFWLGEPVAEAV